MKRIFEMNLPSVKIIIHLFIWKHSLIFFLKKKYKVYKVSFFISKVLNVYKINN